MVLTQALENEYVTSIQFAAVSKSDKTRFWRAIQRQLSGFAQVDCKKTDHRKCEFFRMRIGLWSAWSAGRRGPASITRDTGVDSVRLRRSKSSKFVARLAIDEIEPRNVVTSRARDRTALTRTHRPSFVLRSGLGRVYLSLAPIGTHDSSRIGQPSRPGTNPSSSGAPVYASQASS